MFIGFEIISNGFDLSTTWCYSISYKFFAFDNIKKAAKDMVENQFDPYGMINKMNDGIPKASHDLRTIWLDKLLRTVKTDSGNIVN